MPLKLALVGVLALVAAGTAAGSALDRAWTAPASITAVDETGQSVAAGIAWTPNSCEQVVVWDPGVRSRYFFHAPGPCPATSTGRGIAAVGTLGTGRVAWLSYVGGNTREWRLWTASTTARRPRLLRFASADAGLTSPIVLGNAGEEGIPYAVKRQVVVIGWQGERALSWRAPSRVVNLAEGGSTVGVVLDNGHVLTLRLHGGTQIADVAYPPGAVRGLRVASIGTIVETANGIDVHRANGSVSTPVQAGARLVGFSDGQLLYARGAQIRQKALPDGSDTLVRRLKVTPFLADFDRRGMAWTQGRNLCFVVREYVTSTSFLAPGC